MWAVELTGDHPDLGEEEVHAVLQSEGVAYGDIRRLRRTLVFEADAPFVLPDRLAMARTVLSNVLEFAYQEFTSISTEDIAPLVSALSDGSYRIDVRVLPDVLYGDRRSGGSDALNRGRAIDEHEIIQSRCGFVCASPKDRWEEMSSAEKVHQIIAILAKLIPNRVDLKSPDRRIRVIADRHLVVGLVYREVERSRIRVREVKRRPFSSPISISPILARCIVNISRVRRGMSLLDPFCGTGGILLEAASMGIHATGIDADERMVSGSKINLDHFGLSADLFHGDVSMAPELGTFDAIVTDPPYGRASSTGKEPIGVLYERAFSTFAEVLRPGGYVSIVLPGSWAVEMGSGYLDLVKCWPVRVHRSLTRHISLYRKI